MEHVYVSTNKMAMKSRQKLEAYIKSLSNFWLFYQRKFDSITTWGFFGKLVFKE